MTPVAGTPSDEARVAPFRLVPGRIDGTITVVDRRPVTGQSYARDGRTSKTQSIRLAYDGRPLMSNTEQQILLFRPR